MNDLPGLIKQCQRDTERWFPEVANDLSHHVLSLAGETGELANLVKKIQRGSYTLDQLKDELSKEAVDVLIYLCCIFGVLDIDVVQVYKEKRAFNERRFGNDNHDVNGADSWGNYGLPEPSEYFGSRGA